MRVSSKSPNTVIAIVRGIGVAVMTSSWTPRPSSRPPQGGALLNAEAMLFVDDNEREISETHGFLEQGVRANDDERDGGVHGGQNLATSRRGG